MLLHKDLSSAIPELMKQHNVPGLALSIVTGGSTSFAAGYGTLNLDTGVSVDPETVFGIGSCTKAFTAVTVAQQVDTGAASWDGLIGNALSTFKLSAPVATRELAFRDCLAHKCDLAPHALLYIQSPFSRAETLSKLQFVPFLSSFRSRYSYQNAHYLIAGEAVAALAGEEWDEVVARSIFKPSGMYRSATRLADLPDDGNVASPHDLVAGSWSAVQYLDLKSVAPAGSITTSATDMIQWLLIQLNKGSVGSTQIASRDAFVELHAPQVSIPYLGIEPVLYPDCQLLSYCMGWDSMSYRNHVIHSHAGNTFGMSTHIIFSDELQFGIVVLSNREATFLPRAICFMILDGLLGGGGTIDWNANMLKLDNFLQAYPGVLEAQDDARRKPNSPPITPLSSLEGEYVDDVYGPMIITYYEGYLHAYFHQWDFRLTHFHSDVYRAADVEQRVRPRFLVRFITDIYGDVTGLTTGLIAGQTITKQKAAQVVRHIDKSVSPSPFSLSFLSQ